MEGSNTTLEGPGIRCNICTKIFRPRGFPNHHRACETKMFERIQQQDRIDKAEIARVKKSKFHLVHLHSLELTLIYNSLIE